MKEEHYTVHIGFRVLDPTHGVEETNEIMKIEIPHLGDEEAIDIINEAIDAIHTNIPLSDRAVAYRKAIEKLELCEGRWQSICSEYHYKDVLNEAEASRSSEAYKAFKSAQNEIKTYIEGNHHAI